MFEKLDVSPKNCRDCTRWFGEFHGKGICGVEGREPLTNNDHEGCSDQLSVAAIRASYRHPELMPRVKQVMNEIEIREIQQVLTKIKI